MFIIAVLCCFVMVPAFAVVAIEESDSVSINRCVGLSNVALSLFDGQSFKYRKREDLEYMFARFHPQLLKTVKPQSVKLPNVGDIPVVELPEGSGFAQKLFLLEDGDVVQILVQLELFMTH